MPVERRQDWPPVKGLMDPLMRLYDPFVALAGAAAVTERLLLGFAVCLMTHRDPINTAKAVASLDLLSNGRVILGVAGGALDTAMRNHGSEFKHRWKITRERTLAVRTIWSEELAEFHGEFVDFGPLSAWPKPMQTGGPPIWIGSNSKSVPGRVAEYADGWIVFRDMYKGDAPADLRLACEKAGRDFNELTLTLMDAPREESLARDYLGAGFRKLIFLMPQAGEAILRELDEIAALAERLRA
jgi:probable F420-dependent oxidoreductase